jgi:DNA-binding transcriptional ArsR family regulator
MERLTSVFKALSEPLRLRIVQWLMIHGREAYGEELASALSVPPYQLSRHLKVLTATGLVQERRAGRWVYYSITKGTGHAALLSVLRRMLAERREVPDAPSAEPAAVAGVARVG